MNVNILQERLDSMIRNRDALGIDANNEKDEKRRGLLMDRVFELQPKIENLADSIAIVNGGYRPDISINYKNIRKRRG